MSFDIIFVFCIDGTERLAACLGRSEAKSAYRVVIAVGRHLPGVVKTLTLGVILVGSAEDRSVENIGDSWCLAIDTSSADCDVCQTLISFLKDFLGDSESCIPFFFFNELVKDQNLASWKSE